MLYNKTQLFIFVISWWRLKLIWYLFYFAAKRRDLITAQILLVIVIFFFVFNVPKIVLNLEELVAIAPFYWRNYKSSFFGNLHQNDDDTVVPICYSPPFWAHILGSISHLFLTLNASICCFVYCSICPVFRQEFVSKLNSMIFYVKRTLGLNEQWCVTARKNYN